MKTRAIVCAHHKTGTIWMRSVFRAVGAAENLQVLRFGPHHIKVAKADAPVIILNPDSRWFELVPAEDRRDEDRLLHLIRDPRDVILSAAHYHRTAKEPWLLVPHEQWDGKTYQDRINSLADDFARYRFEMDNYSRRTLLRMGRWNYARPECIELKYEDLMQDTQAALFGRALVHLGFDSDEVERSKQLFLQNSIASGSPERAGHIRSGAVREWESVYDRALADAFLERFGDILIKLGYERDDSWADKLPVTR